MNHQTRLQALSAFLKAQRAKILPDSVGFTSGNRRRTPGLRREEVAQLAGVSPTWYTWLERKYLYDLALESGTGAALLKEELSEISPSLKRILHELRFCPTIITDRRYYIVGWNEAASHVFLDFEQIPSEQRNMIRLLFTRKELQRLAVNWEHFTKGFLAIFRAYYGQYVEDEWYDQFVE
jgi:hypothetical protein